MSARDTSLDLDELVARAAVAGQILAGVGPSWIAAHAPELAHLNGDPGSKAPPWTGEEDAFLKAQLGHLSYAEIGERLGRSTTAVKVHAVRLGLPGPSQHPDFITANGIGDLLGICPKRIALYIDEGVLPGRVITPVNHNRVIHKEALKRWLVNVQNWVYFDPERVRDPHLKRLLALRKERWADAWWTTRQVAGFHGVGTTDVKRYIRMGRLPARQVKFPGRRWGHWYVLRSDTTDPKLHFYRRGEEQSSWSPALDGFLVLGRAVGLGVKGLAALCDRDPKLVDNRLRTLRDRGRLAGIAADLDLRFNPETGALFAPWQDHAGRFPALANAVDRFLSGRRRERDLRLVRGVLRSWARWYAPEHPEIRAALPKLRRSGRGLKKRIEEGYRILLAAGIDPLGNAPGSWPLREIV